MLGTCPSIFPRRRQVQPCTDSDTEMYLCTSRTVPVKVALLSAHTAHVVPLPLSSYVRESQARVCQTGMVRPVAWTCILPQPCAWPGPPSTTWALPYTADVRNFWQVRCHSASQGRVFQGDPRHSLCRVRGYLRRQDSCGALIGLQRAGEGPILDALIAARLAAWIRPESYC